MDLSLVIATSFACLIAVTIFLLARIVPQQEPPELRDYLDTHPPIGDEEFLRLLGDGVDREVALRVRRVVSRVTGLAYDRIYPDLHFTFDAC